MTNRKRKSISKSEPTRYQVALMRGCIPLQIIGYTARKSKEGITRVMVPGLDLSSNLTQDELVECDNFTLKYTSAKGYQLASNIYIGFTGYTERQMARF